MGIFGSKPDPYVLTVGSGDAARFATSPPPASLLSQNGNTPSKSNLSARISPAPSLSQSGNTPSKSNLSARVPMSRQASLSKQKSVAGMRKGSSISNINEASTPHVAVTVEYSGRINWIMKGGTLSNLSCSALTFGKIVGEGLMGTVRFAKVKDSSDYFAVKSMRKDYITKHNDSRHIESEYAALKAMKCSFCVKVFGVFQDATHVHFALELVAGGELFRRLNKKEHFAPAVAKFYASEIYCALLHVHKVGYVYRDLKPENIMLDEDGHCKLVDFGFAMRPNSNGILKTNCGTPCYLSPEQLNGKFTQGYTAIVDWWSFGVFIYELLVGTTPFSKKGRENPYEIYLRILKNKIYFPYGFDPASKLLISSLCHSDINIRLTDPDKIGQADYWEIPWKSVEARLVVPPFVPRLSNDTPGDERHFDTYESEPSNPSSASSKPNGGYYDFPNF